MPANNQLNIMFWNAQGITTLTKQLQLEHFIETKKIDILLLAETFLKPQHTFQLKNFDIHRNDRMNSAHGGVAIAVRNTITYKNCSQLSTLFIKNTSIELLINNQPTIITTAYNPKYSAYFANDVNVLTSSNSQFLLFGDFNAKHTSWNCNDNNRLGNILFNAQQANPFLIFNTDEHTHYPHSGQTPSTIDLLLSNSNFTFDLTTYNECTLSDHLPIICSISSNTKRNHNKIFDYKNADWHKYRQIINNNIALMSLPSTTIEIENSINIFSNLIIYARSRCVPVRRVNQKTNLSPATLLLIRRKNALRRQWQRARSEQTKTTIKTD